MLKEIKTVLQVNILLWFCGNDISQAHPGQLSAVQVLNLCK